MKEMQFKPGFRLSRSDVAILVIGAVGTLLAGSVEWYAGFVVGFVVGHFFLFCNVFRVSRMPELAWAVIFASLAAATIWFGRPGWFATISVSLLATATVIFLELRKPSYHGVMWQRVNPGLEQWWRSRCASSEG